MTNLAIEITKSAKLYKLADDDTKMTQVAEAYIQVHLYPDILKFESPVVYLPYTEALPGVNLLVNEGVKIYSLSDKFSYHDAAIEANPYDGITVVEGIGTNSEVLSIYSGSDIKLRAFGLNKCLSAYVTNCSEISESVNLPRYKGETCIDEVTYINKEADKFIREIMSIHRMTVDFDMLTNYGAKVAFNMHCSKIVDYQLRRYGKIVTLEIAEAVIGKLLNYINLTYQPTKPIQVIGPLFSMLKPLTGCFESSVHPVFGMVKQSAMLVK